MTSETLTDSQTILDMYNRLPDLPAGISPELGLIATTPAQVLNPALDESNLSDVAASGQQRIADASVARHSDWLVRDQKGLDDAAAMLVDYETTVGAVSSALGGKVKDGGVPTPGELTAQTALGVVAESQRRIVDIHDKFARSQAARLQDAQVEQLAADLNRSDTKPAAELSNRIQELQRKLARPYVWLGNLVVTATVAAPAGYLGHSYYEQTGSGGGLGVDLGAVTGTTAGAIGLVFASMATGNRGVYTRIAHRVAEGKLRKAEQAASA